MVSYLEKVAVDGNYFSDLKHRISENQGVSVIRLQKELSEVDQELRSVGIDVDKIFKLQSQLALDSLSFDLAREKLEALGKKKKGLEELRTKLVDQISSSGDIDEAIESLKERIFDFRKGWRKSSAAEQKRLLRRLLSGLVCHENAISVYYYPAAFESTPVGESNLGKKQANLKVVEGKFRAKKGEETVTKLKVQNLRVDGNGDLTPS
ncbi:MAG: hypothetical protein ACXWRE_16845 [Pseudobdellovibrionaceae bacterium]